MGWVYGLHSLDPQAVRETVALSDRDLVKPLQTRGVPLEDLGSDSWDELDENAALLALATTREWGLDKSLLDLAAVTDLYPDLAPVRTMLKEMEDFAASGVPERFHPAEVGLMGIAVPATVDAAFSACQSFVGEPGRRRFGEAPLPLLRRLFSSGLRKRLLTEDYLWQNWTKLAEATEWASQRKQWLGLHMA